MKLGARFASLLAGVLFVACGSGLRLAPSGSPPRPPKVVPFPPPPAKVERIPPDPGAPCVWRDGFYAWEGTRWAWQPGAWVMAPEACVWAAPMSWWLASSRRGELIYLEPGWYRETVTRGEIGSCPEPRSCG